MDIRKTNMKKLNPSEIKSIDDCVKNYIECYKRADTTEVKAQVDYRFEKFVKELRLYDGQERYLINFYVGKKGDTKDD